VNIELVNKIKRLTIIGLASDDNLVETLVLKGGNALEILFSSKMHARASFDLDYSILNDFTDLEDTVKRIQNSLSQTFLENDFVLIDFKFEKKPKISNLKTSSFWGGYRFTFKVLKKEKYNEFNGDINLQKRNSIALFPNNSTNFDLEISKFEFVGQKEEVRVDGYKLYIYTPLMIAFEKLRAICQQLPKYKEIIPSFTPRARAKDFYDIYLIMSLNPFDPSLPENKELLINIFQAKRVPTSYIKEIKNNRDIHRADWMSVVDTVDSKADLKDFEFYFGFVVSTFDAIDF
jgi:predicted nucleotidyltransferase component of viral defense system